MGIIKQGVLGGFKNKVGSVVGVFWRDLNVIRAMPRNSNKPPTKAQLEQRIKFGMVTSFLSLMSDLIDSGYAQSSGSRSPMNEAVSYHLREAVTGVAPNFTLDYTKLRFSSGKLSIPSVFSVDTVSAGKVDFNWSEDGPDHRRKDATDLINLVVYNPTKDRFVMLRGGSSTLGSDF